MLWILFSSKLLNIQQEKIKNIYVFEETRAASLIWRALRQSNYTLALPNLQFIQYIKN